MRRGADRNPTAPSPNSPHGGAFLPAQASLFRSFLFSARGRETWGRVSIPQAGLLGPLPSQKNRPAAASAARRSLPPLSAGNASGHAARRKKLDAVLSSPG